MSPNPVYSVGHAKTIPRFKHLRAHSQTRSKTTPRSYSELLVALLFFAIHSINVPLVVLPKGFTMTSSIAVLIGSLRKASFTRLTATAVREIAADQLLLQVVRLGTCRFTTKTLRQRLQTNGLHF